MDVSRETEAKPSSNMCADSILLSSSGEFDDHTSFMMMMNNDDGEWTQCNLNCGNQSMNLHEFVPDSHASSFLNDSALNFSASLSASSCSSDEDLSANQRNAFLKRKRNDDPTHFPIDSQCRKKSRNVSDDIVVEAEKQSEETQDAQCTDPNTNQRPRFKRGSATDPQSVYARKRREKINERLKILQNLVPNGTKVDISTMLEQAIHYVKFMQLQIKLLSSDEHWMYTPIAFNGCLPDIEIEGHKSSS